MSAIHVPGRETIRTAIDLLHRLLSVPAITFIVLRPDGTHRAVAVDGSHLPPAELAQAVQRWRSELEGINPLAPARIAGIPGRVLTHRDVTVAGIDRERLLRAYKRIGLIDDLRVPIRTAGRLVAVVGVWRKVGSAPWARRHLRAVGAIQPLIESAYLAAHAVDRLERRLPETLTPRQSEVARMLVTSATDAEVADHLRISRHTAKSHARAVLARVGVSSRRELTMRLTGTIRGSASPPPAIPADSGVRLGGAERAKSLLAPVMTFAAEHLEALAGVWVSLSPRLEPTAVAWGAAGSFPLDRARELAGLLEHGAPGFVGTHRLAQRLRTDPTLVHVLDLEEESVAEGGGRPALAEIGLRPPIVLAPRGGGRLVGLAWLFGDRDGRLEDRERMLLLRRVEPLLEMTATGAALEPHGGEDRPSLADLPLTERERSVAELALRSCGNAEIAGALSLSEGTVKNYMTRVLSKCGARSRTELIAWFGDRPSAEEPTVRQAPWCDLGVMTTE